jgi:hypothetical protein
MVHRVDQTEEMCMPHAVVAEPIVTAAGELPERCDRCGAAGKIRAFLPNAGDLTFCGHHANLYAGTIRTSANRILVESRFGWNAS